MTFIELSVITMLADLAAVREHVHKRILIRELAASHKLEQMPRVRMLENKQFGREKVFLVGMR